MKDPHKIVDGFMSITTSPSQLTANANLTASNVSLSVNALQNLGSMKLIPGQLLNITITQNQGQQTTFSFDGQTYKASTPSPLSETGEVRVLVKATTPTLQLEILPKQVPITNINQTLIQETLKQLLPNQLPISQAIQLLSQPNFLQLLPPNLQAQLNAFFDQLFKPNGKITIQDIKNNLANSGLFLENKLKNQEVPNNDLKAKMLLLQQQALAAGASTSAAKLAAILDKAINKITIQQIQFFENPNLLIAEPPLHPESPLKKIQVDIRKFPPPNQQSFEVILSIELPEGEMVNKMVLNNEEQLSIFIWADNQLLEKTIEENLAHLKMSLNESDIETGLITISKTKPNVNKQNRQMALIDIHI